MSTHFKDGKTESYVFGGLAGDDETPLRLNCLWKLDYTLI
jgi:hypothetical protein